MTDTDNCEMWADKLAARQPQDLSPTEWMALNAHVATCPHCSALRQEYDLLTRRIRTLRVPTSDIVPPDPTTALWYTQQARLAVAGQRRGENARRGMKCVMQGSSFRRRNVGIALVAAICSTQPHALLYWVDSADGSMSGTYITSIGQQGTWAVTSK